MLTLAFILTLLVGIFIGGTSAFCIGWYMELKLTKKLENKCLNAEINEVLSQMDIGDLTPDEASFVIKNHIL